MSLDLPQIRSYFPSLQRDAIFFDNPGGTQVARPVLDQMTRYLLDANANRGGMFATSRVSDEILEEARAACADFLNAARPEEIVFGPNMTTLTFSLSRALVRTFNPGDAIVVTRLDHDANITPWAMAAEDRGCELRWVDFDLETGTLQLDTLAAALVEKPAPRLVAAGYASNALGTITPIKQIIEMAHAAGALVFVDAVQYAPHGPIDVQDLDCDFLAVSAYKFFGPHIGALYGRYELLDELQAYRVRPAPKSPPGKFETGTQNHEGIAGLLGALQYLDWLGETFGGEYASQFSARLSGRKLRLKQSLMAIQQAEAVLSQAMLEMLGATPGVHVYGLTDLARLDERVPTFAFTMAGWEPRALARYLGARDVYVWSGNYYALEVTRRLGVEDSGGMVRVGPVHYNTLEEITRLGELLQKAAQQPPN